MEVKINRIKGTNEKEKCYVHLRGASMGEGKLLLTFQKLETSGIDTFHPLEVIFSSDGGNTYTEPRIEETFNPFVEDNVRYVPCDAYPQYHRKTGKVITVGTFGTYSPDGFSHGQNPVTMSFYSVYSPDKNEFSHMEIIRDIPGFECDGISFGCVQFFEESDGDILIPAMIMKKGHKFSVAVVRYSFDGQKLKFIKMSNLITNDIGRGVYEPSIIKFNGRYYVTLRHDDCAMYSVSDDGENFSEPKIWMWNDGEEFPSYNTQAHFITYDKKLYLVYTRKGLDNDHVFRHRAPLVMGEVDADDVCIKKGTETILVPERGARLGNFGVICESDKKAYVTVSEWMQPEGCEKYGSDNTSYIVEI